MHAKAKIMVVADGPDALERTKSVFVQAQPPPEADFLINADEALQKLRSGEYRVVFAEMSAGPEASLEFLQQVWKTRPETIRFMLAGAIEPDLMVKCVVASHHILTTPLDLASLQSALERAECINKLVRNERILSLVSRMRTLPSRPSLYLEVMRELRSSSASAQTVGELVAKDLGISMKLIQAVNSAFYGLSQKVEDPASAVLLLGLETTASLVLSIEAFSRFDHVKPLYFSTDRVWRHSQAVAHSARKIAEFMSGDSEVARHAFTAGLVHDIGKLALALNFEEQYQGALKLAEKNKISPCEVEANVFGATHAETGAYLLSLWGLPLQIVEAVAGHHLPAREVGERFSSLTALHLAEQLQYEWECRREGRTDIEIDLDYPPALDLDGRIDDLRRIVSGEEPEVRRPRPLQRTALKAVSVPIDAEGAPAPLVEVEPEPVATFIHSKVARDFLVPSIVTVGALILALLAYAVSPDRKSKLEMAQERQRAEREAQRRRALTAPVEPVQGQEQPAPPSFDHLKLQALIYNGARSAMVINGRTFRLGDEIGGARIVAVQPQEVIVEKDGARGTLRLN